MSNGNIRIRRLTKADIPRCGQIVHKAFTTLQSHHNMPRDFPDETMGIQVIGSLAAHPGYFGFVAERDGVIIGSNFVDRRDTVAGIGPITVDPAAQGSGAGRLLMQATINQARDAASVRLVQEAFNAASMSLYSSLGFDVKEPLALMSGTPRNSPAVDGEVRPMLESDLPACAELCRAVHRIDRTSELRDAVARLRPAVLDRRGEIVAYASNPQLWLINHGVARRDADMFQLLGAAARFSESNSISLLVPARRTDLLRWCVSSGLRIQKPLTLMSMREYHEPRGSFFPSVVY